MSPLLQKGYIDRFPMKLLFQKKSSSSGFMTVRFVIVMVIVSGFIRTSGQTISRAEYFFDTDPGLGNGTTLAVPFPSDNVVFTPAISTSGLDPGYHVLFIRTKSSDGLWSLYEHQQFIIEVPIE